MYIDLECGFGKDVYIFAIVQNGNNPLFALGLGEHMSQKIQPKMKPKWDAAILCGAGLWGLLSCTMLAFGLWEYWLIGALFVLGGLGWLRERCVS